MRDQYEFLWVSMRGSNWIPCKVLGVDAAGGYHIRYYDDLLDQNVETVAEPSYIRPVGT